MRDLLQDYPLPLRPERHYRSGKAKKSNEFRTAYSWNIAVCSEGFGG
jgi:hypothetical protein